MCHYPKVLEDLQEEIDRLVPRGRLPVFDDIPQLPMVHAVVKEVLRWRPVTTTGVPPSTNQAGCLPRLLLP